MVAIQTDDHIIQDNGPILSGFPFGHSQEDTKAKAVSVAFRKRNPRRRKFLAVKLQADVDSLISVGRQVQMDIFYRFPRVQDQPHALDIVRNVCDDRIRAQPNLFTRALLQRLNKRNQCLGARYLSSLAFHLDGKLSHVNHTFVINQKFGLRWSIGRAVVGSNYKRQQFLLDLLQVRFATSCAECIGIDAV